MFKAAIKVFFALCLLMVLLGPFAFYEGGWHQVVGILVLSIIMLLAAIMFPLPRLMGIEWTPKNIDERILTGIAYALTLFLVGQVYRFGMSFSFVTTWLQIGFFGGLVVGPRPWTFFPPNSRKKILVLSTFYIVVSALYMIWEWSELRWWTLLLVPVSFIGIYVSELVGTYIRSWVVALREIWQYVRSMGPPIGGFALGYVVITLIFAYSYVAIWRAEPAAFKGLSERPNLLDFIYYSVITISTVGYGDILPQSSVAKVLACIEILVGVAWTIVIFAAVFTVVQKHLDLRKDRGN